MMTSEKSYAALVQEAESAVAAVKDPELRRVAFEKILSTLLDPKPKASSSPSGKARQRTKRKISSSSDRAPKSKRGPKAYIEELVSDNFFKQQRTIADVKAELSNRGHHVPMTGLSGPLQSLTQQRRLRRQKVSAGDKAKSTYAYSNW